VMNNLQTQCNRKKANTGRTTNKNYQPPNPSRGWPVSQLTVHDSSSSCNASLTPVKCHASSKARATKTAYANQESRSRPA
jgi:hypothetical protein